MSTGIITTIAGSNTSGGFSGDDGVATAATLNNPYGISLDSLGITTTFKFYFCSLLHTSLFTNPF